MPFFRWYSCDRHERMYTGKIFARDVRAVALFLQQKQQVLVRHVSWISYIPSYRLVHEQWAFFKQLHWLLSKQVRLKDALSIAAQGLSDRHSKRIIEDCCKAISEGYSLL